MSFVVSFVVSLFSFRVVSALSAKKRNPGYYVNHGGELLTPRQYYQVSSTEVWIKKTAEKYHIPMIFSFGEFFHEYLPEATNLSFKKRFKLWKYFYTTSFSIEGGRTPRTRSTKRGKYYAMLDISLIVLYTRESLKIHLTPEGKDLLSLNLCRKSLLYMRKQGTRINLIDQPGLGPFHIENDRGMYRTDTSKHANQHKADVCI